MTNHILSIPLPPPWANQPFQTDHIGMFHLLVGSSLLGLRRSKPYRQTEHHCSTSGEWIG